MKNNKIYLPTLKRVIVSNYSLYNQDINYSFINGINLIIGGNGVGKTTFINIIKYALIGLYKKDLVVRNYQGEKRFFRGSYANCNVYFRNRTKEEVNDQNGYVTLFFSLNDVSFEVKRSLYNTELIEAYYTVSDHQYKIHGEPIRQDTYGKYENSNDDQKNQFLQFNYEQKVVECANLSDFNDFIFFVNQILLFSENRDNVLWSEDAQTRLLSNYLNDPLLEKKRKALNFDSKYQDSIARHRQEEIKAINKVITQLNKDKDIESTEKNKQNVRSRIEGLEKTIDYIENERQSLQKQTSILYRNMSILSNDINKKEKEKEKFEDEFNRIYWAGLNPKYNIYKKQLLSNNICPMCNSPFPNSTKDFDDLGKCFFCHTNITSGASNEIQAIKNELNELLKKRQNIEQQILKLEDELKTLDSEYRKEKVQLFQFQNQLRILESGKHDETQNETSYLAMLNRVDELTLEKETASMLSSEYQSQCIEIIKKIEENLLNSTKNISAIFNEFAEAFLHVKCFLTFDYNSDSKTKMFIPVIDEKPRYDAEELSESQRFFIDYSFRMSILAYFYECPSFYICETPDSSLDLSYEENAANTFMKYLERPNSLILTSNLNNSTFLKCILEKTKNVKILNLLRYGKVSTVQTNHEALQKLSYEIEEIVSERL